MIDYRILPVVCLLGLLLFTGCKQTLVISEVDYAQPIETVVEPTEDGVVHDRQYGLKFNITPLHYRETGDSARTNNDQVRFIRGTDGYYYITATGYKNVYVMSPQKGKLKLEKVIKISEEGIAKPAFNQRDPHVQLLNLANDESYFLSIKGIHQQKKNNKKNS